MTNWTGLRLFENFPELPKETSIVITYPSDGTYDCEAYTKRVYNNPRYWDLGSYDPLAKWQLTQAIRHSLSWDSTNNLYFRALVDSMMRMKKSILHRKNRLCELAGLRRAVSRACAKFMCTQMEDCLFASELEPLPPLARLRRASTRTKPFILILMTIWPKPNHYARTVGRLISALCVTPPALIKAASTQEKKSFACQNCRTHTYLMLGTFCTLMEERPDALEVLDRSVLL